MKLFKRRRKEKELSPFITKALLRINSMLHSLADFLQDKMALCSLRTQKIWLLSFCLVFITASICVAFDSISNKPKNIYRVKPIQFVSIGDDKEMEPKVSLKDLVKIHRFKVYLDSLNAKARDSLLNDHPHLKDTLSFLESLYQNQIKTK